MAGTASAALAALLLLLPAGCTPRSEAAGAPLVRASSIGLQPGRPDARAVGQLRFEAGFQLTSPDPRFGGLSGLWIAADGSELVAVSDRGTFWRAGLSHAADGRLTGFEGWRAIEPGRLPGDPTTRGSDDAEALAPFGNSGLVLAYEGGHRLRLFSRHDLTARPEALPAPPELGTWSNRGMEALAGLADDALLAIAEGLPDGRGGILAWRVRENGTERLSYAPAPGFVPTGAERLGELVYVVERRFTLLGGFRTRIAALPTEAASDQEQIATTELAQLAPPLVSENFEAIAARRAPDERVLLYVLSDDNFHAFQRTLLLQFSYDDGALRGRPRQHVAPAHEGAEG